MALELMAMSHSWLLAQGRNLQEKLLPERLITHPRFAWNGPNLELLS